MSHTEELENFKKDMDEARSRGVDLPDSDDPRVVVQNIMFGERQSVLGRRVMDVSNRELVDQWAAMWENIRDKSRREEEAERRRAEESVKSARAAAGMVDEESVEVGKSSFERTVICGILKSIGDQLKLAANDIQEIVEAVEKNEDDEILGNIIDKKLVAKASMSDLERGKGPSDINSGEWLSIALSKVLQNTEKTRFRSVNALLKIILFKLVPYDLCFPKPTRMVETPGHYVSAPTPVAPVVSEEGSSTRVDEKVERKWASKLDVGPYKIKSVIEKRGGREMRTWYCPYENCKEWFASSRKCGAHLNEHLNRIYECPKCRYQTYSLDGYEHHVCFAGPKMQGSRKYQLKRSRPSAASSGETSKDIPVKVKKEKTDDDIEVIVLDD